MRESDDELKRYNQALITEFRANGGEVSGWSRLLLLTTAGAKNGRPLTTPLNYTTDGERLVVLAADQGGPNTPPGTTT